MLSVSRFTSVARRHPLNPFIDLTSLQYHIPTMSLRDITGILLRGNLFYTSRCPQLCLRGL